MTRRDRSRAAPLKEPERAARIAKGAINLSFCYCIYMYMLFHMFTYCISVCTSSGAHGFDMSVTYRPLLCTENAKSRQHARGRLWALATGFGSPLTVVMVITENVATRGFLHSTSSIVITDHNATRVNDII